MIKKILSCAFWNDVLCSYRKYEKFHVMKRCLECSHYQRFWREMEREEAEFWKEVDKIRQDGRWV